MSEGFEAGLATKRAVLEHCPDPLRSPPAAPCHERLAPTAAKPQLPHASSAKKRRAQQRAAARAARATPAPAQTLPVRASPDPDVSFGFYNPYMYHSDDDDPDPDDLSGCSRRARDYAQANHDFYELYARILAETQTDLPAPGSLGPSPPSLGPCAI